MNACPTFEKVPAVVNGASDVLVEIFGEHGKHISSLISTSLLLNARLVLQWVWRRYLWGFLSKWMQSWKFCNRVFDSKHDRKKDRSSSFSSSFLRLSKKSAHQFVKPPLAVDERLNGHRTEKSLFALHAQQRLPGPLLEILVVRASKKEIPE